MADNQYEASTLDDLAFFRNGKGLSSSLYTPFGKYAVWGSNGPISRTNEILNPNPVVVIGRVGAYCGSTYAVQEPSWVTDNAIIAEPKTGVDIRFLYYQLLSLKLNRTAIGSAQPLITQGGLKIVRTFKPPVGVQETIGKVLGTFDDKIELNQRMNKTLEAMTRALFKSWFVDFDPVIDNALRAGNPIPEPLAERAARRCEFFARREARVRQPTGMNAENVALFPDSFQDSPLGPIPEEWEVKPLDEIADFLNGLALQKYPPDSGESLPVIKIAELRRGVTESSNRANLSVPADYIVHDGDLLFSWSGSLEVHIWCEGKGALNQHLFKVTSRKYPQWLCYHWILKHLTHFRAIASGKATTMGHIQRHHLHEAQCVVPPLVVIQKMAPTMQPLLEKAIVNNLESRNLAATRDALLPKLLSGELRIRKTSHFAKGIA